MKGIVLAGGSGTRLHPITKGVSKQLLPIYDKPMIYYPISVLIMAGINDILIISTPEDMEGFERLLGDGHILGLKFTYAVQPSPDGIAQAFIIGEKFIGNDSVCLILGDNIFYGQGFQSILNNARETVEKENVALIFAHYVNDPTRYGIVEFDSNGKVSSIEENPSNPKSNYAIVGLYFYPNSVIEVVKKINPSSRGGHEITSVNQEYLKTNQLAINILGRGYAWFDTGTHDSLFEAGEFIKVVEKRQGLKIACLEEICFNKGFISKEDAIKIGTELPKTDYGKYLIDRANKNNT